MPTADRLTPGFEAAGWERDAIVLLAHAGAPPSPVDEVHTADPAELVPLRTEWLRDEIPASEPVDEVIEHILHGDRLLQAAVPWRSFAIHASGRPVAMASLVGEGPTAMIEDVYVSPDHRGRGQGAAVVRTALAAGYEAGADLIWLPTDEIGPARAFYDRLGFEQVGLVTRFVRRPGTSG